LTLAANNEGLRTPNLADPKTDDSKWMGKETIDRYRAKLRLREPAGQDAASKIGNTVDDIDMTLNGGSFPTDWINSLRSRRRNDLRRRASPAMRRQGGFRISSCCNG
jgi:hypothetical protein